MGNAESNARRERENMEKAVEAVATAVAAVALAGWGLTKLAGWGLTKLVKSSASEEDEKTNDKGKLKGYKILRITFKDSSFDYFPNEKTNEREKMMVVATGRFEISYQIPSNELEDFHSDSEDEETDEELQAPIVSQACRRDKQISGEKICWRFPGYGKLKMNTDGSVKCRSRKKDGSIRHINPPQAGFGGVIRNESGSLIVGFYGRLKDCCGVLDAELWGIYKGLEIIRGLNLSEVEIESDSTSAIHLIKDEKAYKKSPLKELVERCKATKQETGCTLEHALREGNGVADELARRGRRDRCNDFVSFTTPPDKIIKRLLAADVAAASSN